MNVRCDFRFSSELELWMMKLTTKFRIPELELMVETLAYRLWQLTLLLIFGQHLPLCHNHIVEDL